jgi:outer membrane protein OmpA-like peptidoglycan-associated protein
MAKGKQNTNTKKALIVVGVLLVLGIGGYFLFRKKPEEENVVAQAYNDLLFATNTSNILASSFGSLDELAKYLQENPNKALRIIGHTDNVGSDSYNLSLSQKRADAVKNYLLQKGVPPSVIVESIGMGEAQPIASNDTSEGRETNRRVEFIL